MNTFQLSNPNEQWQPEESESWELKDFDDVLQGFEVSKLENELIYYNNIGWYANCFH